MKQVVSATVAEPRFLTVLLGSFAGLAVLLALLGVYGVTTYEVSRRTYEIGVRLALLYGVEADDPTTFASVALLVVTLILLAVYLPAQRATRLDPNVALRTN